MNWWQISIAVTIIIVVGFMIFAGVFEYIAFREQNTPKDKSMADYNREHADD